MFCFTIRLQRSAVTKLCVRAKCSVSPEDLLNCIKIHSVVLSLAYMLIWNKRDTHWSWKNQVAGPAMNYQLFIGSTWFLIHVWCWLRHPRLRFLRLCAGSWSAVMKFHFRKTKHPLFRYCVYYMQITKWAHCQRQVAFFLPTADEVTTPSQISLYIIQAAQLLI